jgi:hypothetical protein
VNRAAANRTIGGTRAHTPLCCLSSQLQTRKSVKRDFTPSRRSEVWIQEDRGTAVVRKLTRGVMAMNRKGFSQIGLYFSTLNPDKIREFYEAFWVLISDRRHDKDQWLERSSLQS